MWVILNRCLKLSAFIEQPFTSKFAIRTKSIMSVETGKDGFFRVTLNDGTEMMCEGNFDELMAYLGTEVEA